MSSLNVEAIRMWAEGVEFEPTRLSPGDFQARCNSTASVRPGPSTPMIPGSAFHRQARTAASVRPEWHHNWHQLASLQKFPATRPLRVWKRRRVCCRMTLLSEDVRAGLHGEATEVRPRGRWVE